jgi:hypothetical protein
LVDFAAENVTQAQVCEADFAENTRQNFSLITTLKNVVPAKAPGITLGTAAEASSLDLSHLRSFLSTSVLVPVPCINWTEKTTMVTTSEVMCAGRPENKTHATGAITG